MVVLEGAVSQVAAAGAAAQAQLADDMQRGAPLGAGRARSLEPSRVRANNPWCACCSTYRAAPARPPGLDQVASAVGAARCEADAREAALREGVGEGLTRLRAYARDLEARARARVCASARACGRAAPRSLDASAHALSEPAPIRVCLSHRSPWTASASTWRASWQRRSNNAWGLIARCARCCRAASPRPRGTSRRRRRASTRRSLQATARWVGAWPWCAPARPCSVVSLFSPYDPPFWPRFIVPLPSHQVELLLQAHRHLAARHDDTAGRLEGVAKVRRRCLFFSHHVSANGPG